MEPKRKAPGWLFGWPVAQVDNWGTLPAVPMLYLSMLAGSVHILVTRSPYPSPDVHTPEWVVTLWQVTTLTAPLLALLGWWLVSKCTGSTRLSGLWIRFAGDFNQAMGLLFFLTLRVANTHYNDDAHVYLMYVAMGMFLLVLMLVVRDVWILLRVREVAADLELLAEADIDSQEA